MANCEWKNGKADFYWFLYDFESESESDSDSDCDSYKKIGS